MAQRSATAAQRDALADARRDAANCRRCELWCGATQTVFGEGPAGARLMLVGEQPGDKEDLIGEPFVGPAGTLLDNALYEAGIHRHDVYLTNAVKHFRFHERGKRRIHEKPSARHITACAHWLTIELETVRPHVLVALGATAGQALFGRDFRVTESHGQFVDSELAPWATGTLHPSAVLRMRSESERRAALRQLIDDLALAATKLDPR